MTEAIRVKNPGGRTVDVTPAWFQENRRLFTNGRWRVVGARRRLPEPPSSSTGTLESPRRRPLVLHLMPWQMSMGGAQRFFCDLARHFKSFCDIHIIYPKSGSDDHWSHDLKGVHCHAARDTAEAAALLSSLRPDLIHHHHPSGRWLWELVDGKYPVLGTQHGWEANKEPMPCVAPICGDHDKVIRHGVDLNLFKPTKRKKRNRVFTVGVVGRRSPEKVPPSFVGALADWKAKGLKVHFIGRGLSCPQTEMTEARLRDIECVELIADVPPHEMPKVYHSLDALFVPSRMDSISYAALEAMACRTPVIARRVQGLPDTIAGAGILCDTDEQLLAAAEYLKDNLAERQKLRKRARRRVEKLFDLKRMLADYEKLYGEKSGGVLRAPDPALDVSVVIPVFNTPPKWLRESVVSAMDQKGARFEILCVDDGSTEAGTLDELRHLGCQEGVRVIRIDHGGVGPACNAGVMEARADLIARHDADDIMLPGRLATQLRFMTEHPDIDLMAGQMDVMDADGRVRERTSLSFDESKFIGDQPWAIAHPTVCYRRYPVLATGGYIDGPAQDFDLWCRLHLRGYRMHVSPDLFTQYRRHPGQETARKDHGKRATQMRRRYQAQWRQLSPRRAKRGKK
jgi:glycosyltransferase involved in cell wall biosynthesis